MLKIKFVGAIEGVSGSCTWLHHTDSDTQFLVDCGMHQGTEREEWANNQAFPFQAARLKYVLLTHAHIDHCGLLPRLVREGFTGLVYATRATRELTELMLLDAARVSGMFTEHEVKQIQWSILDDDLGFKWGRIIRLAEGIRMSYLRSSHILGACLISISWKVGDADRTICFSGDVGCQTDENAYLPLMKSGQHPFADTDYIVVESTYGGRVRAQEHQDSQLRLARLAEVITHTLFVKGGKVLMPAFSLHRAQELLMDVLHWMKVSLPASRQALERSGNDRPITANVHAPLGHAVTQVYARHLCSKSPNGKFKYLNADLCESLVMHADEIQAMLERLVEHGSFKAGDTGYLTMTKPKQPSNFEADIVIASAGMCDNGPAVSYLERWGNDPRNTVILTGYQTTGSKGADLMQRATASTVPMDSLTPHLAEVIDMSPYYSAHADQQMLLDFLFRTDGFDCNKAATLLINHGNPESKYELRKAIQQREDSRRNNDRKIKEVIIADARWLNLDTGEVIEQSCTEQALLNELESLRRQLEILSDSKKKQDKHRSQDIATLQDR
ncbi:MBL fold metallo-hydrolase [Pseudomonas sp. PDM11]|uniref:MBL fold metallo-hydrolase n=1 Tax=Pseudomonas sp. PDM11 TaxID=2769309 RepID=UPI0017877A23|nr:MBL fold metallo-hydrolase [Pseudomonas sp. PDM11]MBD9399097.1 MBL fold metallo-hydrolase [Pseudomonas sp. PDM11]